MVLLYLSEEQKVRLNILNQFDESVVKEFCRISIDFLQKEVNNKIFNSAAKKLNIEFQELKNLIELVTWILTEYSRLNLNENEFKESLALAGLNNEIIEEIFENSKANFNLIQTYLKNLKLENVSYKSLEWRIDIKLATRSLRKCYEPEIILKLNLSTGKDNELQSHLLQTDVTNLVHLTNSLEEALNEIKTNYCRKVFRSGVA